MISDSNNNNNKNNNNTDDMYVRINPVVTVNIWVTVNLGNS